MGLTSEQFSHVRRALCIPDVAARKEDPSGKRHSARWSVEAIVAFAPCVERVTAVDPAVESLGRWVTLIDLSVSGASVLSKTQLAPGEFFVLALPSEGEAHLAAVCVVQYSRVKLDGTFRIGAQFCDAATAGDEKVAAAVASLRAMGLFMGDPAGGGGEADPAARQRPADGQSQRRSERRQAEGRAVIHVYDEMGEPGPIEEVPTLDFSETGVCIFRREPMKVGDYFMARVPVLNARPIISLCRVTNVAACEGESRYRIGAEFTQFPGLARRIARTVLRLLFRAA